MPWIYLKQFYPIRAQTSDKNKIPCNTYTVIPETAGIHCPITILVIYNFFLKKLPHLGQPRKELIKNITSNQTK